MLGYILSILFVLNELLRSSNSFKPIHPVSLEPIAFVISQRTGEPWSWDLDLVLVLVSFSVSVSVAVVSEIYESPRLAVTGYRLWVQGISMSVNTHNNC